MPNEFDCLNQLDQHAFVYSNTLHSMKFIPIWFPFIGCLCPMYLYKLETHIVSVN